MRNALNDGIRGPISTPVWTRSSPLLLVVHCVCGGVRAAGQFWMGHNKTALWIPEMVLRVMAGMGLVDSIRLCPYDGGFA